MSTFFVGQRVRAVRSDHVQDVIGMEGVIVEVGEFQGLHAIYEYRVNFAGMALIAHGWELEPILPEGMKPARWEDCLWQPEHMRESARG